MSNIVISSKPFFSSQINVDSNCTPPPLRNRRFFRTHIYITLLWVEYQFVIFVYIYNDWIVLMREMCRSSLRFFSYKNKLHVHTKNKLIVRYTLHVNTISFNWFPFYINIVHLNYSSMCVNGHFWPVLLAYYHALAIMTVIHIYNIRS